VTFLLDMHEDGLSEYFCGEGIPKWAVKTWVPFEFMRFPFPLKFGFGDDKRDSEGFPTKAACDSIGSWPKDQVAIETEQAVQALYTNPDLLEAWGNMFKYVLRGLKGYSNILGIELINEPNPGNA